MNIQHWENFLKVAQSGSLSRVAEQTDIAQPVLSRQIRQLEQDFKAKLFERHGRGMRLTPAGETFRKRAESILQQISLVQQDLKVSGGQPSGQLIVGMPPSMTAMLTGKLATAFVKKYPLVHLRLRETTLVTLRQALLSGEIEFGVASLPLTDSQLAVQPLLEEPMFLVGPIKGQVSRRVTLKTLSQLPLILPQTPNTIRLIVENALERAGYRTRIIMEADFSPAFEAIAAGLGYCVIPGCAITNPALGKRVTTTKIRGMNISWGIVRMKNHKLSLAAEAFQTELLSTVKRLVADETWEASLL